MASESVTPATIREALTDVEDPEIPINVVDLGLIYDVSIDGDRVSVDMTLTSLACPAEDMLRENVVERIEAMQGVESATVDIVWDPPWTADRMSEEAREKMREFGLTV
jgi:phenylacetate-CoA oxygenase PaaJ subunit